MIEFHDRNLQHFERLAKRMFAVALRLRETGQDRESASQLLLLYRHAKAFITCVHQTGQLRALLPLFSELALETDKARLQVEEKVLGPN